MLSVEFNLTYCIALRNIVFCIFKVRLAYLTEVMYACHVCFLCSFLKKGSFYRKFELR